LQHVKELENKMRELQEMADTLRHLAKHCSGDERPHCPIIEDLAAGRR
jgi:MerR family transcriptional regulator, copper efflux regulator